MTIAFQLAVFALIAISFILLCVVLNIHNHDKLLVFFLPFSPDTHLLERLDSLKEEFISYLFNCRISLSLLMTFLHAVAFCVDLVVMGDIPCMRGNT